MQGIIPWLLIHTCLHNLWPALPVLVLQSASEHVLYFVTVFFLFLQYYVLVTLSFFGNTIEENLRPSFLGGVNDAGVGET